MYQSEELGRNRVTMNSIPHYLKKLFSRAYRRQLAAEERQSELKVLIQEHLEKLPRCEGQILVATSEDQEEGFFCDVTVPARVLLAWAREDAEKTVIQNVSAQAAREALPIWLANSTFDTRKVSRLPGGHFGLVEERINDWVTDGTATVYCPECGHEVQDVAIRKANEVQAGRAYFWWTDIWSCPRGHLLRQKDQEIRFILRPHRQGA